MPTTPETNTSIKRSLGLIDTPDNTFSNDLQVSDRYQAFSAEMLRLALLGIAGIGFLVVNILLRDSTKSHDLIAGANRSFMAFMSASLVCLGLSAAFSLGHRYLSTDSLACHLRSLRLERRDGQGDREHVTAERKKRKKLFWYYARILFMAASLLWLGAIFLALSFIFGILS
jgi:hypothetical protein